MVGAFAAYFYALDRGIPWSTALTVLPAFLLEVSFYFVLGVEGLRSKVEKLPKPALASLLSFTGIVPYILASTAQGSFSWLALGSIAAMCLIASFWYVLFPQRPFVDILYIILMALPMLFRVFPQLYASPIRALPLATLGQLMWFRTGLFAMVSIRHAPRMGFGFWPKGSEWRIGALYFAVMLPVVAALAWYIDFAKPHLHYADWLRTMLFAIGTFFGVLWVVALGEEFFFRGLVQQWTTTWFKNDWAGLIVTSLLFGSVHLWFRAPFPNWRVAGLMAVGGFFYGLAFRHAKSIRASMVTHALTVTTWRVFFS
jgi:membrane protease YdiL (CAAX protease family)